MTATSTKSKRDNVIDELIQMRAIKPFIVILKTYVFKPWSTICNTIREDLPIFCVWYY